MMSFGRMIWNGNKMNTYEGVASRKCCCILCGGTISKGEERYEFEMPNFPSGKSAHKKCARKMWDTTAEVVIAHGSEYNSNTAINHTMVVIAPKEAIGYFASAEYETKPYSPTHRKYVLKNEENCYRSGHSVTTCLAEGFRVFINGEEVFNHDDYDRLTKTYR